MSTALAALRSSGSMDRPTEIAVVFREMAVMLGAGVTIAAALQMLAGSVEDEALVHAFLAAEDGLYQGRSLSQALRPHADLFAPSVIPLIRVGEDSGRLPEVLQRLAATLERQNRLRMRVRSALTYPLFMSAVCLLMVLLLPGVLLDGVFKMLVALRAPIPPATRALMVLSELARNPLAWLAAAGIGLAAAQGLRRALKDPAGRRRMEARLLRVPHLGPALRGMALAQFALALETMYSSGIPLLDALRSAAGASGSGLLQERITVTVDALARGARLEPAMRAANVFPNSLLYLMAAADASGNYQTALLQYARMAESDVDNRLDTAVAALEPAILLVMGLLVGGITLAAMSPLMSVLQKLAL